MGLFDIVKERVEQDREKLEALNYLAENNINIDFHVIVAYGVGITTVADNLIETVTYKVEKFTGMKINKINIHVEGVRVID